MVKNRIAELIFCNDRFRIISHYLLPSTVVKHPDFYYHLTTIDGIDLPHFAIFCFSRDLSHRLFTTFSARQIAAKRGRVRLFRRLIVFDKDTFCVHEFQTITDCLIFQNGFKLGARMMGEVMEDR